MAKAFLTQPLEIDQRKIRTEAKLLAALVSLRQQAKAFKEITVQDLCQQAHVSRATFYRHHDNIADVIIVAVLTAINEFQLQVDQIPTINFEIGSSLLIEALYQHLNLFALIPWSQTHAQVENLFGGAAQQILRLREKSQVTQRFVSQFIGRTILDFNIQIATSSQLPDQTEALALFRLLIPNRLELNDRDSHKNQ
ncbi:TetR/AcrR family transcriptional regulator [Lacticaseibacillus brantae]|uniref:HTH tetR-type domain-containing protein n=1 Tax=Lacticaseibacillus brantae DSM 23927 TaxID=1423727 RepID=A0A0R2B068_9LACO|nr:TetR/AcrR family transcriptional regulator [Lacticaseibacillus brantae]KRM72977.1 hypothetical protein FC34_GL000691 [Lacticaseibacillus brantae DSM 23927]